MTSPVLLVDAGNFFVRAVFAAASAGVPDDQVEVEVVESVVHAAIRLIEEHAADFCLFCFDGQSPDTWHQKHVPDYQPKSHSMPERLKAVMPQIRAALEEVGIRTLHRNGFEGDDLIASAAATLLGRGRPVRVISNEVKLLPLLDSGVELVGHFGGTRKSAPWVFWRFGVTAQQISDWLVLVGYRGGYKGLPGCGPVQAKHLLSELRSLPKIISHAYDYGRAANRMAKAALTERGRLLAGSRICAPRTDLRFGLTLRDLNHFSNRNASVQSIAQHG